MAKTTKLPVPGGSLLATAVILLSSPAGADSGSGPVTADNWLSHPMIKAVRGIYNSVEEGIASGQFQPQQRAFQYCEPYEDVLRIISAGNDGHVRKYQYDAGSDDSAIQVSHYYDESEVLRFVFARAGAVNDTVVEYRIYFDETGNRFWHRHRRVAGPGYAFPAAFPDEDLVREPKAAFAAENACPEKR